ncbi:hypothetical protein MPH_02221 [Macrophomina phaseolina MS6]|uniref:Secreted protein n=1 Tax=Macrophomina phaseolina (strain MS6) TaxID=1126212 RepID=K2S0L6_MACPH|nr:hypothetical protein MPH_02221 [Macrophomina phaseolina MS6]
MRWCLCGLLLCFSTLFDDDDDDDGRDRAFCDTKFFINERRAVEILLAVIRVEEILCVDLSQESKGPEESVVHISKRGVLILSDNVLFPFFSPLSPCCCRSFFLAAALR